METNWKHSVQRNLQRSGAKARGGHFDGGFHLGSMLPPLPITVACGDLEMDRLARRAVLAGADLPLTDREFDVLLCLADHADRVVHRTDLLEQVWTLHDDSNLVAVYIGRLRRKLGAHAPMIMTVRGIGYRLLPALDRLT